jgi:hypothetical protein
VEAIRTGSPWSVALPLDSTRPRPARGSSNDCKEFVAAKQPSRNNFALWGSTGADGVVPLRTDSVGLDGELLHFALGDLDAGGVVAFQGRRGNLQAGSGGGTENPCVARVRESAPGVIRTPDLQIRSLPL